MRYFINTQEPVHVGDLDARKLDQDTSGNELAYKLLAGRQYQNIVFSCPGKILRWLRLQILEFRSNTDRKPIKVATINPANMPSPPKVGITALCTFLSSGSSNNFLFLATWMITGMAKNVIRNDNAALSRMLSIQLVYNVTYVQKYQICFAERTQLLRFIKLPTIGYFSKPALPGTLL